ncbi:MAG: hypothetical protein HZB40_16025 [Rhodocyclales bacterium]|nr:hypothetical protein [Rhodocyclales bacterium]
MLLARIYEIFPLAYSQCGGTMRIIAFIDDREAIREKAANIYILAQPFDSVPNALARDASAHERKDGVEVGTGNQGFAHDKYHQLVFCAVC